MKECPRCHRQFEKGNYCTYCGGLLEEKNNFDIFGDPLNNSTDNHDSVYQDQVIYDQNNEAIVPEKEDNFIESKSSIAKSLPSFVALLSIGVMFLPFYGTGVALFGLILNARKFTNERKNLAYMIICIITLLLSIIFLVLLIVSGVLMEVYQSLA